MHWLTSLFSNANSHKGVKSLHSYKRHLLCLCSAQYIIRHSHQNAKEFTKNCFIPLMQCIKSPKSQTANSTFNNLPKRKIQGFAISLMYKKMWIVVIYND